MKFLSAITALIFSFSAFALTTEVECLGIYKQNNIRINIQGRWNTNYNRPTEVIIKGPTTNSVTRSNLTYRAPWGGLNRVEYIGQKLKVEINFWTEPFPRAFKIYFGNAFIDEGDGFNIPVKCKYPYAPYP